MDTNCCIENKDVNPSEVHYLAIRKHNIHYIGKTDMKTTPNVKTSITTNTSDQNLIIWRIYFKMEEGSEIRSILQAMQRNSPRKYSSKFHTPQRFQSSQSKMQTCKHKKMAKSEKQLLQSYLSRTKGRYCRSIETIIKWKRRWFLETEIQNIL